MTVKEAAVGRARRGRKECDRTRDDHTKRGGERSGEEGRRREDRLSSSSSEHGKKRFLRSSSARVLEFHQDGTKVTLHERARNS